MKTTAPKAISAFFFIIFILLIVTTFRTDADQTGNIDNIAQNSSPAARQDTLSEESGNNPGE
jgi:hypothetical protein